MNNPYGAVPEALKETRLTLRDVMSDFLQNKVLEGRMTLEKTRAETETALVNAGIEKDRLANLRDMAHLKLTRDLHDEEATRQAGQFQLTYGLQDAAQKFQNLQADRSYNLQEKGQALQEKTQTEANVIAGRHATVAESAEARQAREEARKNETKTAAEWVQAAGMSPGLLEFLGVSANMQIKRVDAENLYHTLSATFKSNPSLGLTAHGYGLKADLTAMQTQLKDPKLDPAKKTALKTAYDAKLRQFENLDQLIMAEKTPDQAKIVQAARQTYADSPQLQTEHPNFDQFLKDFQKDVSQARSVFHEDIKKLKNTSAMTPADEAAAEARIKEKVVKLDAGLSPRDKVVVVDMLKRAKEKGTWSQAEPAIDRLLAAENARKKDKQTAVSLPAAARQRRTQSIYDRYGSDVNQ